MSPFDLAGLTRELETLTKQTEAQDFWNDPEAAQKILKQKKAIESKVNRYESLEQGLHDVAELIELAEEMEDEEEADSIAENFARLRQELESLKLETLLDGKYDHSNAIISVHAGTGGVDAMDWAQMLYRMYTRWAEKKATRLPLWICRTIRKPGSRAQP